MLDTVRNFRPEHPEKGRFRTLLPIVRRIERSLNNVRERRSARAHQMNEVIFSGNDSPYDALRVKTVRSAARAEVTDEMLMARYQRGDLGAFNVLVERHKTPLYNFVLRQIKAPPAAQDLTQEVFLRIIESASSFKHEAKFT